MDEATFEDLASLNRASRKPDRVGWRVCINSGQWIQKTRNFCPSESKAARFQASLPQNGDCPLFCEPCLFSLQTVFSTHCPSLMR
ncbi:MAG: hypothetical protein ISS41_07145 [Candidatus Aminicenantes bacterium]|nr:hypothetical protein [Candidatus Aminicenantes bacterium]